MWLVIVLVLFALAVMASEIYRATVRLRAEMVRRQRDLELRVGEHSATLEQLQTRLRDVEKAVYDEAGPDETDHSIDAG